MLQNIKKLKLTGADVFSLLPWLLLLPALVINIHLNPLLADEPIRALVALEMYISDNIWTPSMNGEYYYNKPPLYNWILLSLFNLLGSFDEWVIRIPTILSLVVFCLSIYIFFRSRISKPAALLIAFATISSGRILFYDSFLGLIDCTFSLLIFWIFIALIHYSSKKKWLSMFLICYTLTAAAFLMKGLPAPVFTGISILAIAFSEKKWAKLFSWQHALGIISFFAILGAYYFFYQQYNSLEQVFTTLWAESAKRTVAETSIIKSISHILSFPFQFLFHFLPFSILVVFVFAGNPLKLLRENALLRACTYIFLFNIIIYWFSPETRPRYLFMLLPMFFALPVFMFLEAQKYNHTWVQYLSKGFMVITAVLAVAGWVPFFVLPSSMIVISTIFQSVFIYLTLGILAFCMYKKYADASTIFISALLIARVGFNFFVLPYRQLTIDEVNFKKNAESVARLASNNRIYFQAGLPIGPTESFYISRSKKQIVKPVNILPKKGEYLIIQPGSLDKQKYKFTAITDFEVRYQKTRLQLVRMEE